MRGVEFIRQAFGTYFEPLYLSRVCDSCAVQAETIRLNRSTDAMASLSDVRTVTVSIGQPVALGLAEGNCDGAVFVEGPVQECRAESRGGKRAHKILTYGDLSRPSVIVSWLTKWHSDPARTNRLISGAHAVGKHDRDLAYLPAWSDGLKLHRKPAGKGKCT
jgi:hypothetical protein